MIADVSLYTDREQLEKGKTYDELWNAAQLEMVRLGKMHGFMRMWVSACGCPHASIRVVLASHWNRTSRLRV